uniref:Uncharacterized protein n=1 Tax=Equus caballus TaxID=9796 RepID=A0A9L0RZ85_HORSE
MPRGPSRSGRGVRRPWGKRWGAGSSRGSGARRQARSSVWETSCVSAERLQDCRRPWGRRRAEETAEAAGANAASGTPATAGSTEAAGDPGTVWVNGAVGEPQVVGPAGSVWVTGTGEEEETVYRSPRCCERKGRPGSMGHESILELWLKVQAMRAASGCGEGSRVELHPVPAGGGPVERGVPGRASWVETSRVGLTGPWVKGQAGAVPRATGVSTAAGLGAGCERTSGSCGQGQAVRVLPVAVGVPGAGEKVGYGVAPGPWGKGPTMGVPGAMEWPEAVEVPRAVEGGIGYGGASGLWERGQSVQVPGAPAQEAACGDTPGLWGRGQAAGVPDAVEEETISVGAPGMWRRRLAVEETGPGGIPGLWGSTAQPVGVPCAIEEEARCGGDPGSWEAAQTAEVSGPEEHEAGPGGAPGLWGVGQAMGVPRALGKETGCGTVPRLWETEQPVGLSQAVVVPGAVGEQTSWDGGIPGLWGRQQALGVPVADVVPGVVGEETCCGNVPSLWERRQAMGEQGALVPTVLGVPGPVDQETAYGDVSCLCRRRQAVGLSETVGIPEAAGVPKHRCAPAGVPSAMGVPGSGRVPARAPAAVWVSGPMCQESSSRDVLNLWERIHTAGIPMASGVPVAPEELWSVGEDPGSVAFPESWGRRQVPTAPRVAETVRGLADGKGPTEVPGPSREETVSGGLLGLSRRKQIAEMPVAARVSMAMGVPTAAGVPGPMVGDTSSGDVSAVWGRRSATEVSAAARAPGPVDGEIGSEGVSSLRRRRPDGTVPEAVGVPLSLGVLAAVGVPMAGRVPAAVWVTGSAGEEMNAAVSGLTVVRSQSIEGPGPSGEETGGGSSLGLTGRSRAVGVSCGRGTRLWSCPRSVGEGADYEDVPEVSRTRRTRGVNEAAEVPPVSSEETDIGRFRDHLQQSGRRQTGGVGVRGSNLGENYVGEDRLRGMFQ